jgi:hypothetical protein
MNPPPTETAALPLTPATITAMQSAAIDALPPCPGAGEGEKAGQREGALAFLAALRAGDAVQAMLAVHIVASHYAAMEYFRRAAREDMSLDMHLRIVGKAVALCRIIARTMDDLARRQGIPALRAAARPVSVPVVRVQSAPEAVRTRPAPEAARVEAPAQLPVAKNRHERRAREQAVRHFAVAAQRAGLGAGAVVNAMQERLRAEVAARAAAPAVAGAV